MSKRRIVVFGEGAHELGQRLDSPLSNDHLPALPCLIHRLLDEPDQAEYSCTAFKSVPAVHGKGPKFGKKVKRAILKAHQEGHQAAVIVIDRDAQPDAERIQAMRQARDEMVDGWYPPCAVTTAVETFDAWMIVDGKAIKESGGDHKNSHSDPEALDGRPGSGQHPKDKAAEIFGGLRGLGGKYAAAAKHADLGLLRRRCPKGFEPFAQEVEQQIGPIFGRTG